MQRKRQTDRDRDREKGIDRDRDKHRLTWRQWPSLRRTWWSEPRSPCYTAPPLLNNRPITARNSRKSTNQVPMDQRISLFQYCFVGFHDKNFSFCLFSVHSKAIVTDFHPQSHPPPSVNQSIKYIYCTNFTKVI